MFNLKDKVYFMFNDTIVEGIVTSVKTSVVAEGYTTIDKYLDSQEVGAMIGIAFVKHGVKDIATVHETSLASTKCFKTLKDLILHLESNMLSLPEGKMFDPTDFTGGGYEKV